MPNSTGPQPYTHLGLDDPPRDRRRAGDVLVGVDGSPGSRAALVWAAREAVSRGVGLRVVCAVPVDEPWADPLLVLTERADQARSDTARLAAEEVDRARAELAVGDRPWPEVTVQTRVGLPTTVLETAAVDAALLVVGSRGRGAARSVLLGSVSLHVVVHAGCPVVVVPGPGSPHAPGPLTPQSDRRVVVGVDSSAAGRAAVREAAAHAARAGSRLVVVAAVSELDLWSPVHAAWAPAEAEIRRAVESRVQAVVAEEFSALPPAQRPDRVDTSVLAGPASGVLIDQAQGAELLVVGTRNQGEARGLVLGSVALHAVLHAPCPVLVVRAAPADEVAHPDARTEDGSAVRTGASSTG